MIHERKYMIINDTLVKRNTQIPVPGNEPLFILRSKDRKAMPVLLAYLMICDKLEQRESVKKSIDDFRAFQEKYPELMGEPEP